MPRPSTINHQMRTVSVIGAGRLGTALGVALQLSGYQVEAVVANHLSHASKAARLISKSCQPLKVDQLARLPSSAVTIIATPDDVIPSVAEAWAATQTNSNKGRIALHTSGALASEVLRPLSLKGFAAGSLHPLVSVSDSRTGARALASAYYCLEGDAIAMRIARRMVKDLGGQSFTIKSQYKARYHAAAVMSSGHVTALFDLASEVLASCGLDRKMARRVLLPLLESTWRNLLYAEPFQALTGTYARGDEATVRKHLESLKEADALAAYRLLGLRSLELYAQKGGDPAVIKRISSMLKKRP
ncbi:MAG TPA: Rossmann-like and DUF2520 domain-containing protein [Pyrinomonadaceae bacterium]|nr:Rossmann-like and DUF2520 domain-containing protein [Pyrinomonadaceae bacterium]